MSSAPPNAAPFTPSAEAALAWAAAAARLRERAEGTSPVPFSVHDLFVGVALAHDQDERSTVRALLGHFGIPLGAVVAGVYRPALDARALARARADVAGSPSPDAYAGPVVAAAQAAGILSDTGLVPLSALVLALLQGTHPVAHRIRGLLAGQGVDAEAVARAVAEHVRAPQRGDLRTDLDSAGLAWPPQVRLMPYGADVPGERAPAAGGVAGGAGAPDDLIGIAAEVDALAYLICSTNLAPPLAVGLFGDWGSGKSYFMRALQRRVDAITAGLRAAQADPEAPSPPPLDPNFHSSVVQIEFNAWHYVEGELWASLVEHIFQNLRQHADEDEEEVRRRRDVIIGQIATFEQTGRDAAARITALTADVTAAQAEVDRLREEEKAAGRELERARDGARIVSATVLSEVDGALTEVGGVRVGDSIDHTVAALAEARASLLRGRSALSLIRAGGWSGWLILLLVIAVMAVLPLASWALDALGAAGVTNVLGSVGATLAVAASALRAGSGVIDRVLDRLDAVREQVEAERRGGREGVARAEEELAERRKELVEAEQQRERAGEAVSELRRDLAAVPTKIFSEFLDERVGSDDYRRHLGVPALIRRDFERLTRLVGRFNARIREPGAEPADGDDRLMNRIVLYIDDLDRCPADRVVKVLQAVHLLLAFPIFVVVVAVDSRWLEGSLRRRYGDLLAAAPANGSAPAGEGSPRARPEDYLEKIFQVPFRVQALGADERRSIIHGVLDGAVAPDGGPPPEGDGSEPSGLVPTDDVMGALADDAVTRTPSLAAEALTVTPAELAAMDEVAPLLGDTPRAVKRFTNVYLLIKSIARHSGRGDAFAPDAVILLLAVATGQPRTAADLFAGIRAPAAGVTTFRALVAQPGLAESAPAGWAPAHPRLSGMQLTTLEPWIDDVARFSFVDPARAATHGERATAHA